MSDKKNIVFLFSDGTGETASGIVKAALVHYHMHEINIVKSRNLRTPNQLEPLLDEAKRQGAMMVHTFANRDMRQKIQKYANKNNLISIDLLGPLMNGLATHLDEKNVKTEAGLLRAVDDKYFKRIEAIEFTVKHDDGKSASGLDEADIILVGISRTSKTPLSIFLSHKGWKVANVPLVLGTPLPKELFEVDQRKIVGLQIDPDSLLRIRRKRLEKFGQDPGSEYASKEHIFKEIDYANELFKKNKRWPVFSVTDRALEETAAEIIRIVATRMDLPTDVLL